MARETRLYKALQRRGLKVEYVPGWTTRGSSIFRPFGALAHWTAGPATGDRPSLNVCVNGRAGLPGPLCQVFLTRAGVAVVVAAGRANHAGRGYYKDATGNTDLFGCECEWNGQPGNLTAAQKVAYPKVMATFMDLGAKWIAGHDEYALPKGRKIDVGSYINTLRAQTYALAGGGSGPSVPPTARPVRDVLEIQIGLAVLGLYDPGNSLQYLDRDPGPAFIAAVTKYQRRDPKAMAADGHWGKATDNYYRRNDMAKVTDQIASAVWYYKNPDVYPHQTFRMLRQIHANVGKAAGERAGLLKAIQQVSAGDPVDLDAIEQATRDGVAAALGDLEADVNLTINKEGA